MVQKEPLSISVSCNIPRCPIIFLVSPPLPPGIIHRHAAHQRLSMRAIVLQQADKKVEETTECPFIKQPNQCLLLYEI